MSGVYIPNMEIPKRCGECFFLGFRNKEGYLVDYCLRLDREIPLYNLDEVRMKDCPLVGVTTHGRLIDVDKLLKEHPRISSKYPSETFYENLEIFNMLSDAPTVIEAST